MICVFHIIALCRSTMQWPSPARALTGVSVTVRLHPSYTHIFVWSSTRALLIKFTSKYGQWLNFRAVEKSRWIKTLDNSKKLNGFHDWLADVMFNLPRTWRSASEDILRQACWESTEGNRSGRWCSWIAACSPTKTPMSGNDSAERSTSGCVQNGGGLIGSSRSPRRCRRTQRVDSLLARMRSSTADRTQRRSTVTMQVVQRYEWYYQLYMVVGLQRHDFAWLQNLQSGASGNDKPLGTNMVNTLKSWRFSTVRF